MDRTPSPSLLPIFRSQQQAELLALILSDSAAEFTLTELVKRTGVPYPSIHREIERATAAGLVTSRNVGRTRLIRANATSPYFVGLSDVLAKAFGVPWIFGRELCGIAGINQAFVYGSWAARFSGESGVRPVGDIDLLVLGEPDRDALYAALGRVEIRLGRPVQVSIRRQHWLTHGHGSFHDTIARRPLVPIDFTQADTTPADRSSKHN